MIIEGFHKKNWVVSARYATRSRPQQEMESTQAFSEPEGRWLDTYKLLERPGPLAGEAFEPDTPDAPKVRARL